MQPQHISKWSMVWNWSRFTMECTGQTTDMLRLCPSVYRYSLVIASRLWHNILIVLWATRKLYERLLQESPVAMYLRAMARQCPGRKAFLIKVSPFPGQDPHVRAVLERALVIFSHNSYTPLHLLLWVRLHQLFILTIEHYALQSLIQTDSFFLLHLVFFIICNWR